eukprot:gene7716-9037_t
MIPLPKLHKLDFSSFFYLVLYITHLQLTIVSTVILEKFMSVRELFPFFKWGFNIRRSNFLVPILSNNIIVTGEEAVSFERPLPAREPSQIIEKAVLSGGNCLSSGASSASPQQQQQHYTPEIPRLSDLSGKNSDPFTPSSPESGRPHHPIEQRNINKSLAEYTDQEIIKKIEAGELQLYKLEHELAGDCNRAVAIRRTLLEKNLDRTITELPHTSYDFSKVLGACCENVIGYVPIPVGAAGPMLLNGQHVTIPMATTEGCLVASTHRGCRAISESGGAKATIISRGMTRAPVIRFPNITKVAEFCHWLEEAENYETVKREFDATSRFARLSDIKTTVAGRSVYIRFKCDTGDAMGMNMVSKAVEAVLNMLKTLFIDLEVLSLSGNLCTDKKPSAINWIDGRGRTVVCEAVITGDIVQRVLKTSVQALIDLNISKNLVGSAMAGSIGGFNAHASNIVTAVFLATGQDCAQNVESSNCITLMESCNDGNDLYITVTMPSIEVGTVGGGTFLPAQASCLDIIGVRGSVPGKPGYNADQLARTVAAAVMAGELSLMSALSAEPSIYLGIFSKNIISVRSPVGTKRVEVKDGIATVKDIYERFTGKKLKWLCNHPPGGKCSNCMRVPKNVAYKCTHGPTAVCGNCIDSKSKDKESASPSATTPTSSAPSSPKLDPNNNNNASSSGFAIKPKESKLRCNHGANAKCPNCLPKDDESSTETPTRRCKNHGIHGSCIECIEWRESLKMKLKRQEAPHCPGIAVDVQCANVFQQYVRTRKFEDQRCGFLYGTFREDGSVSVDVIYEPPQKGDKNTFTMLEDKSIDKIESLAKITQAAQYQNKFGKSFVTLILSINSEGNSNLEAFQVSDQALKLEKTGDFAQNQLDPLICKLKTPVFVEGAETLNADNNFFIVNVPVKARDDKSIFNTVFPVNNRVPPTSDSDLASYKIDNQDQSKVTFFSDFHFLVYLAVQNNMFDMVTDMPVICENIRSRSSTNLYIYYELIEAAVGELIGHDH